MGRDIPTFPIDEKPIMEGTTQLSSYPPQIQNLVASLKSLQSQELQLFFSALFQAMSPASKQAITDIIWSSLSPNERQLFEFPSDHNNRWNQHRFDAALRTAFTANHRNSETEISSTTSTQIALVPRRRLLSEMIELDLGLNPQTLPFRLFPGVDNLSLRDIVTGFIANTRGVNVYSFEAASESDQGTDRGPP